MSRLARNCPILTGGKIWNWQKLADECRKCGRPIWCFVVVCNLNILSHLLQVFLTDLQSQHIFSAFACIIKFNRSPKVWSLTIGSSLPIFQRWCVLNLPFWEESVSHWDVKLASKSCWKPTLPKLTPSLVMTPQARPTKRGRVLWSLTSTMMPLARFENFYPLMVPLLWSNPDNVWWARMNVPSGQRCWWGWGMPRTLTGCVA